MTSTHHVNDREKFAVPGPHRRYPPMEFLSYLFLFGPSALFLAMPGWKYSIIAFSAFIVIYICLLQYVLQFDNAYGAMLGIGSSMITLMAAAFIKLLIFSIYRFVPAP